MRSPAFSHYPHLPVPFGVRLTVLPATPCPYLAGKRSTSRAALVSDMSPGVYHKFMDAGFRRSGRLLYQPLCNGCRECQQMRVPVDAFAPSKSQRRCARRNADLVQTIESPEPTAEKFEVYRRYAMRWHEHADAPSANDFAEFLYDSPLVTESGSSGTIEIGHRDASGRLLGVGICDVTPLGLSSVYFYFDPDVAHRGLGTFGALYEIEYARSIGLPYYYLGYYVSGCASMSYKANYRPYELLGMDGRWRTAEPPAHALPMPDGDTV
jgi:arginine-tRNA-protein transferase